MRLLLLIDSLWCQIKEEESTSGCQTDPIRLTYGHLEGQSAALCIPTANTPSAGWY